MKALGNPHEVSIQFFWYASLPTVLSDFLKKIFRMSVTINKLSFAVGIFIVV